VTAEGTIFLLIRSRSYASKSREDKQTNDGKNNKAKGKHGSYLLIIYIWKLSYNSILIDVATA